jgi:hypothetical protein
MVSLLLNINYYQSTMILVSVTLKDEKLGYFKGLDSRVRGNDSLFRNNDQYYQYYQYQLNTNNTNRP